MFIRKKKLIKMLKEMQFQVRRENNIIKQGYIAEENMRQARDMQFYGDGNDNAFNWIIRRLEK